MESWSDSLRFIIIIIIVFFVIEMIMIIVVIFVIEMMRMEVIDVKMILKNLWGCYERGATVFVPSFIVLALIVIYLTTELCPVCLLMRNDGFLDDDDDDVNDNCEKVPFW